MRYSTVSPVMVVLGWATLFSPSFASLTNRQNDPQTSLSTFTGKLSSLPSNSFGVGLDSRVIAAGFANNGQSVPVTG